MEGQAGGADECTFCEESSQVNPRLCEACQKWNSDEHLFTCERVPHLDLDEFSAEKRPPALYGQAFSPETLLEDLVYTSAASYAARSKSCMVCYQVYSQVSTKLPTFGTSSDILICPFRPFAAGVLPFDFEPGGLERKVPHQIECVLPLAVRQKNLEKGHGHGHSTFAVELVLHYDQSGHGLLRVSHWDRSFFNLDFLQAWLLECQQHHDYDCNETVSPMSLPHRFRVIDTDNRCVVFSVENVHYDFVALSYVWASASDGTNIQLRRDNEIALTTPGSLVAGQVPSLVDDAIVLCSRMGQRYLWVDRLCIVQDDEASKFEQIHAMDAIYHLALFTIVALANGKDAIGLPGSPGRPRKTSALTHEWHFAREGRGAYAYPRPGLVNRSEWNTRGWTFQERLLSGRHLFVSADQILACCGKCSMHANVPLTPDEISLGLDQGNRVDLERGVRQIRYFRKYRIIVQEYSTKRFSFGSDILNAFTGIAQVVGYTLSTSFLHGMPERFLLESLLWGPRGVSERRDEAVQIPSWSWAAWNGELDYRPIQHFDGSGHHVGSLVGFHFVDGKQGLRRVESCYHFFSQSFDGPLVDLPERGKDLSMRQWRDMLGLIMKRPGSVEIWEACPHNPTATMLHLDIPADVEKRACSFPGYLVFNTTMASLRLRETSAPETNRSPIKNLRANQEFLLICDSHDEPIGITMWMDLDWRRRNISLQYEHEFIVLGAGVQTYQKYDVWPHVSTDCEWALYVMLVERYNGVHRRVAIGAVAVNTWASVHPHWETIILG